jgi:hypothetical protein
MSLTATVWTILIVLYILGIYHPHPRPSSPWDWVYLILLGICWIWETRFSNRTGLPPEFLLIKPTPAAIKRRTVEIEREIDQIEEFVGIGIGSDNYAGPAASILERMVEWEDFVEPGFEREKARIEPTAIELDSMAKRAFAGARNAKMT